MKGGETMSKAREVLYGVAMVMVFALGPALIETQPLYAIGAIAIAAVFVRLAGRA